MRISNVVGGMSFNISINGSIESDRLAFSPVGDWQANTWYYVCFERDDNHVYRAWVDGIFCEKLEGFTDDIIDTTKDFFVGQNFDGTSGIGGNIEEMRIVVGQHIHGDDLNFSVPTEEYPRPPSVITLTASPGVFTLTGQAIAGVGDEWTPADLAVAPWTWFKMDELSGSDGDTVSALVDASGNGRNTTGVTSTPNLETAEQNGLNVLRIQSGESYTLPSMAALTSGSCFAVFKSPSESTAAGSFIQAGTNGDGYYPFSNGLIYSDFGANSRHDAIDGPDLLTDWHIAEFESATNAWMYLQNGVPVTLITSNTVAFTASPLLGRSTNNGGQGMLGEIILLPYVPNAVERAQIEGYLAHKWGIEASLPAWHPFKDDAPTTAVAGAAPLDGLANLTGAWSVGRYLLSDYSGGPFYRSSPGFPIWSWMEQSTLGTPYSGTHRNFQSGGAPTITTAGPNSRAAIDLDGSAGYFVNGAAISNFIGSTAAYMVISCLIDAVDTDDATAANNDALFCDDGLYVGLFLRNTAGTYTVRGTRFSGSYNDTAGPLFTISTPVVISLRIEGGNTIARVNNGTEVSVAGTNIDSLASILRFGMVGSSRWVNGKIFEAATFNTPPDASTRDAIEQDMMDWIGV